MSTDNSQDIDQYSLWQILGIWAAVALPMGFILWVAMPFLIPRVDANPAMLYFVLITLGLVWQGVLAFLIVRREVRPFTWQGVKDRLWLNTPINPRTGLPSNRMYLWTLPIIALMQAYYIIDPLGRLDERWVNTFPFLAAPDYAVIENMAEPALGQWWLLGVLAVLILFNYILGEELIFRGVLVPKMNGVFGRWDFLANGILFSVYHLHLIWHWPTALLVDWVYPWAAKRFKSYWVAVIIHGVDALFLIVLFPMAIMGMLN